MGRARKQDEVKEGLPMWMGTFSDLVTLMMAFFVMLVAMASFEDTKRIEAVIESIHTALGVSGFDSNMIAIAKKKQFTEDVRRDQTIQPVVAKLRQAMAKHVSDNFVRMVQNEQELRIRIDGGVFFQPGSAQLPPHRLRPDLRPCDHAGPPSTWTSGWKASPMARAPSLRTGSSPVNERSQW